MVYILMVRSVSGSVSGKGTFVKGSVGKCVRFFPSNYYNSLKTILQCYSNDSITGHRDKQKLMSLWGAIVYAVENLRILHRIR